MNKSNRGAARVSIIWMIVVGIIAIAALVFAFIQNGELADKDAAVARAQDGATAANEERQAVLNERREISRVLGYNGGNEVDPKSNVASVGEGMNLLRDTFPSIDEEHVDLEAMIPLAVDDFNALQGAKSSADSARTQAVNDAQAQRSALSTVTSEKDGVIQRLNGELADQRQGADEREADLSRSLSDARDRVRELEEEVAALRAEARNVARDSRARELEYQARIANLGEMTKPLRAPANLNPDGSVLEVSRELPLGWIDLGANDRLVLGTRFRVESGNLGERRYKAMCEVVEVQADSAKVRIYDQADAFDPVVAGDMLINPVYDPKSNYNAILVGRFSGMYGKPELTALLENIGIHVQSGYDLTTTFLIAGGDILIDEESGMPLEEPIAPSELPAYQEAIAAGVQVIPVSEVQAFFVF